MLIQRHPQLLTLSVAQALYWSCSIIGIALTALVGQRLAPWPWMATVPLTLLVAGNLLAIGYVTRWMQRLGRARGLQCGALFGIVAGLLAAYALQRASFALFCAAMLLLGVYQATAGFYRFAALDGVDTAHKGSAAAWVLAGGIAAAVIAPSVAVHASGWLATPMVGAYLALAALAAVACAVLQALPSRNTKVDGHASPAQKQPLPTAALRAARQALWRQPAIRQAITITACGHGLMILVMNATPLAMHGAGHALASSTQVIQWHVLGMFLPSLVAGKLVDRFGARRIAWLGTALLAASAMAALVGMGFVPFLVSSLLLGAGWNCMLLAGTTLLAKSCPAADQPVAQPLMEWANSGAAALMSFSCGVLVQTLGWQAINVAMLLVLALLVWQLLRAAPTAPLAADTPRL